MSSWHRNGPDPELWINEDEMIVVRQTMQLSRNAGGMSVTIAVEWDHIREALAEHDRRLAAAKVE